MNKLLIGSLAVLAAAGLAMTAPASAAPAGPSAVDAMINQLQAQGFDVVVNRVGAGAPEQCTFGAIRGGQTFFRRDSGAPGAGSDLVTTMISNVVYVDLNC